VDSDSVNLGSNPSSPATTKAHEIGTSGDFGPVERAAKSEQNAYTGCTEPGTDIPTEPKAFGRWLNKQAWERWPVDLFGLSIKALHALQAPSDPRWADDYEYRKRHKGYWSAFTTAYRAHKREVA